MEASRAIDIAWKIDPRLEIPVDVVEARFRKPAPTMPPAGGHKRVADCWAEVAELCGLEILGSALVGRYGATNLSVWSERSATGARTLGLGLEIKPAGGWLSGGRELAVRLEGAVNQASLAIRGRYQGHPVAVRAAWTADGEPVEIVSQLDSVRPFPPIASST